MRASGTDNSTASSYVIEVVQANSTTLAASRTTSNQFSEPIYGDSASTNAYEVNFYRPFLADQTGLTAFGLLSLSSAFLWQSAGTHNQATSYDGFSILLSAGTFTGSLYIYGWSE